MNGCTKLSLWWLLALACATGGLAGCAISLEPADATQNADGGFPADVARDVARPDATPPPDADTSAPGCPLPTGGVCPRNSACWSPDGCSQCYCSPDLVLACTANTCVDAGPPPDAQPPPDAGPRACRGAFDCAVGQDCVFDQGCNGAPGRCAGPLECPGLRAFCGCDGQTFMDCDATQPFAHAGACEQPDAGVPEHCDPSAELGCPAGQECVPDPGCTTQGWCVDLSRCREDAAEFCDCNGATFRASGNCPFVMYAHAGACEPPPDAGPPRPCGSIRDCVAGEACVFPAGCGTTVGNCQPVAPCDFPAPYCGCDGATYSACAPVRPYAFQGACPTPADAGVVDSGIVDAGLVDSGIVDDAGLVDSGIVDDAAPDTAVDAPIDASLPPDAAATDGGIIGACRGARIGVDGLCYSALGAPYPLSCCRGYVCDQSQVFCRSLPPDCPDGQVPEVINNCWGPCVLFDTCAPIACMPGDRACPSGTHCDGSSSRCVR